MATATAKEEDQILARLGHIGAWQWKVILITGLFSAPSVCHVMIMTFMNAEVRNTGYCIVFQFVYVRLINGAKDQIIFKMLALMSGEM